MKMNGKYHFIVSLWYGVPIKYYTNSDHKKSGMFYMDIGDGIRSEKFRWKGISSHLEFY
jgi:hypothetical protein